jgi:hypothetical protein
MHYSISSDSEAETQAKLRALKKESDGLGGGGRGRRLCLSPVPSIAYSRHEAAVPIARSSTRDRHAFAPLGKCG